jgi:hypothetical protein
MTDSHPASRTIGGDFTAFILGLLDLKTKMATPGYNFGEWPLAILSEVFFYFIRLHAPVNVCVQRQQYPNAGCN